VISGDANDVITYAPPIPEPAAGATLGVAALTLYRRRRRG